MIFMKRILSILFVLCMTGMLWGCSGSSETGDTNEAAESETQENQDASTDEAEEETGGATGVAEEETGEATEVADNDLAERYFGISLPLTNSEYYKGVQDNLTAVCEEYGIEYAISSADNDISKQVAQIENFITMGVDTLIIYPLDKEGISDTLLTAKQAGIRILSATMAPNNTDAYDLSVDADQTVVGDAGAQYLAKWIDENYPDAEDGSIEVCVFGVWLDENTSKRCDAFANVEQYSSKVKIIDTYEIGITDAVGDTQKYTELMMQQHPEVKGIISYTDSLSLIINEVMISTPGFDISQVCNVTIDKTAAVMEQIQLSETNKSTIRATVASGQDFNKTLVDAALGNYDDQLDSEKKYYVEAYVIDFNNVEEAIQSK